MEREEEEAKTKQKREIYRDTLNYQTQIKEFNKDRLGAMTQVEKQYNKADLRAYKNK